jgi:hypothetical protein
MSNYILAFSISLCLGILNSWYWYRQGYRGGRLLFLGTIAFFGIIVLLMKAFLSK